MSDFQRIALIGRPGHAGVVQSLQRLVEFLRGRDAQLVMDEMTYRLLPAAPEGVDICERDGIAVETDLVVVVGGDGSMLNVARQLASDKIPVIGVNRGRLGFLTDILPAQLEAQLGDVLDGRYSEETRFLLNAEIRNGDSHKLLGAALNDVVLHPGKAAQMIEFELFVDGLFVNSQESDGLIIATPTGSTAYSLSAGGPIMHPGLNAVVLVPMNPHTLSSRPLVVDGDSEIRIVVSDLQSIDPMLSCDGEVRHEVGVGDEIFVRKQPIPLRLIHPLEHSFYEACRSKLGWGNRLLQTEEQGS